MADTKKSVMVTLSTPTGKDKETKKQQFEVSHANRILKIENTKWKLADDKFKWNGQEIASK